jgi:O-antigen/teichoic acid export membrane protein
MEMRSRLSSKETASAMDEALFTDHEVAAGGSAESSVGTVSPCEDLHSAGTQVHPPGVADEIELGIAEGAAALDPLGLSNDFTATDPEEPGKRQTAAEPPTPAAGAMQALESTALKATFWTIVDYGGSMALRIVNSLVLTRLLLPAAFGELTLVATLITGATMLTDIGLAPSVIQSKRGDDPAFLNTVWTMQTLRGAILWLITVFVAYPVSLFYRDQTLLYILPALALTVILSGMYSTNLLTLSRHMGVRKIFLIDISTQVVQLMVTIGCALRWPSVWALVIGNIASNFYKLILSHNGRLVPGVRNRFLWDRGAVEEIFHFAKWIFIGTAFYFFAMQSDKLILGKLVSFTLLGVYGIAYNLSDLPRSIINQFSYKVGYPFIAKIIDLPRSEFRTRFLRYRLFTLLAGGALLSVLVVFGDLLVTTLYPPAFHQAAWMVQILALGLWHTLMYMTVSPVLLSLGKSKYNAIGNGVFCASIVLGIPAGFYLTQSFHGGMLGAVIAVAAGDFPYYLVIQYGAIKEGIRPLKQDLVLTAGFIGLITAEYLLRHGLR